jgi:hypothetical protein
MPVSFIDGGAQVARHVLLVRPRGFGPNQQTRTTNRFQSAVAGGPALAAAAQAEFAALAGALDAAGVGVTVAEDTDDPVKPDAVFPNNWASFHGDGSVILYPLAVPNRRPERRRDVLDLITARGFDVRRIIDLAGLEQDGVFLEGTGSLVLDRPGRVAYAALSARTSREALPLFARATGYEVVAFEATDAGGVPVYHTNVVLSLGERFAVVCSEAIRDERGRQDLLARLAGGGRRLIEITLPQVQCFAGNVLELGRADGGRVLALSQSAADALTVAQHRALRDCTDEVVAVPVPQIERAGGGSVRCMIAEIFLPPRAGRGAATPSGAAT